MRTDPILQRLRPIADSWGLCDVIEGAAVEVVNSTAAAPSKDTAPPAVRVARLANDPRVAPDEMLPAMTRLDPSRVIAAAFRAAGLPVSEVPTAASAAAPRNDPRANIEAALKAAGLRRWLSSNRTAPLPAQRSPIPH